MSVDEKETKAKMKATTELSSFVRLQSDLLSLEREEELSRSSALLSGLSAKELAIRGLCLRNLNLNSRRTGLFGRTVLEFGAAGGKAELPAHDITVGKSLDKIFLNVLYSSTSYIF